MDLKTAKLSIVGLRGALGVGSVLMPRLMGKLFGVESSENPALPYVLRLFGVRELLMAWQVYSAEDDELEKVFTDAIPVDAADVAAAVLAGAAGYLPKRAAIMAGFSATMGVAHGVLTRRQLVQARA